MCETKIPKGIRMPHVTNARVRVLSFDCSGQQIRVQNGLQFYEIFSALQSFILDKVRIHVVLLLSFNRLKCKSFMRSSNFKMVFPHEKLLSMTQSWVVHLIRAIARELEKQQGWSKTSYSKGEAALCDFVDSSCIKDNIKISQRVK